MDNIDSYRNTEIVLKVGLLLDLQQTKAVTSRGAAKPNQEYKAQVTRQQSLKSYQYNC